MLRVPSRPVSPRLFLHTSSSFITVVDQESRALPPQSCHPPPARLGLWLGARGEGVGCHGSVLHGYAHLAPRVGPTLPGLVLPPLAPGTARLDLDFCSHARNLWMREATGAGLNCFHGSWVSDRTATGRHLAASGLAKCRA